MKNDTLYISHQPTFLEVANLIVALDKKKERYNFICSMVSGEIVAYRVINDAWEILA